ncbi:hypothetical protein N9V47_05285 [Luminiphilus sp.]|nr:hypothetical protein [Luminiphilus sp.]MDB2313050.1 hypothetical protein [Luminiphilus sp.]
MSHDITPCVLDYEDYKFKRSVWEHWGFWWNALGFASMLFGLLAVVLFDAIIPAKLNGVISITTFLVFLFGLAVSQFCYRKVSAVEALIDDPDMLDFYKTKFLNDKHDSLMLTKSPTRKRAEKALIYAICIAFTCFCVWLATKVISVFLQWPLSLQFFSVVITLLILGNAISETVRRIFFESVRTVGGKEGPIRVRTAILLISSLLCVPMGFWLVTDEVMIGATLVMTLCPCLFLYPVVRGLFYGGKDSIAGVVTTVVAEEVIKGAISSSVKKAEEKRRRR